MFFCVSKRSSLSFALLHPSFLSCSFNSVPCVSSPVKLRAFQYVLAASGVAPGISCMIPTAPNRETAQGSKPLSTSAIASVSPYGNPSRIPISLTLSRIRASSREIFVLSVMKDVSRSGYCERFGA